MRRPGPKPTCWAALSFMRTYVAAQSLASTTDWSRSRRLDRGGHGEGVHGGTNSSRSGRPLPGDCVSLLVGIEGEERSKHALDDLEARAIARVEPLPVGNVGGDAVADALGDGRAVELPGGHGGRRGAEQGSTGGRKRAEEATARRRGEAREQHGGGGRQAAAVEATGMERRARMAAAVVGVERGRGRAMLCCPSSAGTRAGETTPDACVAHRDAPHCRLGRLRRAPPAAAAAAGGGGGRGRHVLERCHGRGPARRPLLCGYAIWEDHRPRARVSARRRAELLKVRSAF